MFGVVCGGDRAGVAGIGAVLDTGGGGNGVLGRGDVDVVPKSANRNSGARSTKTDDTHMHSNTNAITPPMIRPRVKKPRRAAGRADCGGWRGVTGGTGG